MNLPNKITMVRMFMVPIFIVFMLCPSIPYNNYFATGVFILASITDFIDGYIARKQKLITDFGKFMDPLADKLLICSALICFVADPDIPMPAWIVIIIIGREFIISGFRLIASDNGIVIAASMWGKVKTVVQMVMSVTLMLKLEGEFFEVFEQLAIYTSLAFTVISMIDYIWHNKKVIIDSK